MTQGTFLVPNSWWDFCDVKTGKWAATDERVRLITANVGVLHTEIWWCRVQLKKFNNLLHLLFVQFFYLDDTLWFGSPGFQSLHTHLLFSVSIYNTYFTGKYQISIIGLIYIWLIICVIYMGYKSYLKNVSTSQNLYT